MTEGAIKDGRGSGRYAGVDSEGRLKVISDVVPHPQHHSMTHHNLFLIPFCVTLQSSDPTPLAFFKNIDPGIDFEFYLVQFNSSGDAVFEFRFDDEFTSGGLAVTPANLYRGSGLTLPQTRVQVYEGGTSGNLVLDSSNGFQFHRLSIGARSVYPIDFQGGLILTNNKTASLVVTGTSGDTACMLAMCSYHDAGTQL